MEQMTQISFPENEKCNFFSCISCKKLIFYTKSATNFVRLTDLFSIEDIGLSNSVTLTSKRTKIVKETSPELEIEHKEVTCSQCGGLLGIFWVSAFSQFLKLIFPE